MIQEPKYPVKTVEKAIEVINCLANDIGSRGVGITEISEQLGMGKSTVHRLLDTLLCYDFIEKNEATNCYRLGWRLHTIGQMVPQQNQITGLDSKYLLDVATRTNEIANLGLFRHNESVIISQVDGSKGRLKVNVQAGTSEPIYATALGKILLSEESDETVLDIARKALPFHAYTERTVRTPEEFLAEVKRARRDGYAIDREEYSNGLICTARPIRNYTGRIIAAMSVSMPTTRHNTQVHENVLAALLDATERASRDLGYRD